MKRYLLCLFFFIPMLSQGKSLTIELENDLLFKSDKNYTHGTRITYQVNQMSYSLGQNMYTPSDISISSPITNERAYAGILYFGTRYIDIFYELECDIGVMGEHSGTDKTQKLIHSWTGSKTPMGWEYQIDDGLLFQINGKIHKDLFNNDYLSAEIYADSQLGTVFGNVGIGATLISGYNVPKILDNPIMSKTPDYSSYSFIDIHTKYVFWNSLINSDYTNVEKTDSVSDIRYGLGISYKFIELRYGNCIRTKEYKEQKEDSKFGSLFIKINF